MMGKKPCGACGTAGSVFAAFEDAVAEPLWTDPSYDSVRVRLLWK